MDISRPESPSHDMASRPSRPQDPEHGTTDAEPEDAMNERDEIDRRIEIENETENEIENETTLEHPRRCGCVDCDPDFYFDPAERDAPHEPRCAA